MERSGPHSRGRSSSCSGLGWRPRLRLACHNRHTQSSPRAKLSRRTLTSWILSEKLRRGGGQVSFLHPAETETWYLSPPEQRPRSQLHKHRTSWSIEFLLVSAPDQLSTSFDPWHQFMTSGTWKAAAGSSGDWTWTAAFLKKKGEEFSCLSRQSGLYWALLGMLHLKSN